MSPAMQTRELASRNSDGVHVLLLWHPAEDTVTVSVEDVHFGESFHVSVALDCALDAFYHPYAYAAMREDSYRVEQDGWIVNG